MVKKKKQEDNDLTPTAIVKYPSKVLLTPCKPVTEFGLPIINLVNEMILSLNAMPYGQHLGLAANQIGVDLRVIIMLGVPMVNPEFTPCKQQTVLNHESCYSLPEGEEHVVERAKYGWLTWQEPVLGTKYTEKVTGLAAIVVQHEIDHINGIVCSHK